MFSFPGFVLLISKLRTLRRDVTFFPEASFDVPDWFFPFDQFCFIASDRWRFCWREKKNPAINPSFCHLTEFTREVTDTQMPLVAPVILPEMYKIFTMAEVSLPLFPLVGCLRWHAMLLSLRLEPSRWLLLCIWRWCCRFTVFARGPEPWRSSPPVPTSSVLLRSLKRWSSQNDEIFLS